MPPDIESESEGRMVIDEASTESDCGDFHPGGEVEYLPTEIRDIRRKYGLPVESATESEYEKKMTKERNRKYICSYKDCKETFRRKTQYDRHFFKHTAVKQHKCTYDGCDKSYTISTHLKRHIQTFHENTSEKKQITCDAPNCGKIFQSKYSLDKHCQRRHERGVSFDCQLCDKKYRREIHLKRHIIEEHSKKYACICEFCSKKFPFESDKVHHVCKTYSCESCSLKCENWTTLLEHRRICNAKYKCDVCPKQFKLRNLLEAHSQIHKPDSEKVGFNCTFEGCSKFYTLKKNLDDHFRRKHGDKATGLTCEKCDRVLSTKQKLENHLEFHKRDDLNKTCNICEKMFSTRKKLSDHMRFHNRKTQPSAQKPLDIFKELTGSVLAIETEANTCADQPLHELQHESFENEVQFQDF